MVSKAISISETKLDDSFPAMQFLIEGYVPPYRLDLNSRGGGILVYVREDIPCKLIPMKNCTIEGFFLELNLRSKKWLISCSYNPHRTFISHHLNIIGKNLDLLSGNYENIFLMGDFNADMENINLKNLCDLYNFKNLIKEPTCFKNPVNTTGLDLMLTNSYRSFQNSCAIETGLSDFHRMVVTVMKAYFQKQKPKVVTHRDYKDFSENDYRQRITYELSLLGYANDITFDLFMNICKVTLDKVAPLKQKHIRSNHSPFLNKEILKAIMNKTRLRNKFLRSRSTKDRSAYNQQINFCLSLVRKTKKDYYNNLDHKKVTDSRSFWRTVKPLFSEKNSSFSKITLIENGLLLNDDEKISFALNDLFSNVVSNLILLHMKTYR